MGVTAVLRGLQKLSAGRYLACFPSATTSVARTSVSIHEEIDYVASSSSSAGTAVLDVQSELEGAEAVYTSEASLFSCFRMWQWPSSSSSARNSANAVNITTEDTRRNMGNQKIGPPIS